MWLLACPRRDLESLLTRLEGKSFEFKSGASLRAGIVRKVEALLGGGGVSTSAVAARVGKTPRVTRDRLRALVDSGLVVEVGSSPNDPQRKYFIAEDRAGYRVR